MTVSVHISRSVDSFIKTVSYNSSIPLECSISKGQLFADFDDSIN